MLSTFTTLLADTVVYRWGPGPWFLIFPLLWLGLIALLVLRFRRGGGCGWRGRGPGGRDVLDERFARGEITADEYRERRSVLDEGGRR
jgi:putative membrane protein